MQGLPHVGLVLESRCRWPSALLLLFHVREGRRPPAGRESSPPVRSTPPEGGPEGTPGPRLHPGTRSPAATPDKGGASWQAKRPVPAPARPRHGPAGRHGPKCPPQRHRAMRSPVLGRGVTKNCPGCKVIIGGTRSQLRAPPSFLLLRQNAAKPEAAASLGPRPSRQAHLQGPPQSGPTSPRPPRRSHGEAERGNLAVAHTPHRPRAGRPTDRERAASPPDPKLQARLAPSDPAVDYGAIRGCFCILGGCPRHEGRSLTILAPTGDRGPGYSARRRAASGALCSSVRSGRHLGHASPPQAL
ncbi:hypothetical protein NDU88_004668 [Pleurodeles waltl]|uniref:Uncharacterized protein n=1 Tax=Pleurodeles waltl TaxID=8319 RepID=A0AAV7TRW9_PLEWA|nr:hypothetical protein NDU88_004668 [Pleurodeles waltl]